MGAIAADDKYSGVLEARLERSRLVAGFVAVAAPGAAGVLALTPLPLAATLLALTWVACTALHALHRAGQVHRLRLECDATIVVDGAAGRVCAGSFVAPWLAIIRWRPAGARFARSLLVAPDMLSPDDFRALRVLLRNP